MSEDARRRDGAQDSQIGQMDEKYFVQNIESPGDLGPIRERQDGGAKMLSSFYTGRHVSTRSTQKCLSTVFQY